MAGMLASSKSEMTDAQMDQPYQIVQQMKGQQAASRRLNKRLAAIPAGRESRCGMTPAAVTTSGSVRFFNEAGVTAHGRAKKQRSISSSTTTWWQQGSKHGATQTGRMHARTVVRELSHAPSYVPSRRKRHEEGRRDGPSTIQEPRGAPTTGTTVPLSSHARDGRRKRRNVALTRWTGASAAQDEAGRGFDDHGSDSDSDGEAAGNLLQQPCVYN